MLLKKKKYINYIILADGSAIKKKSFKNQKITELLKDNYNYTYILNLNEINKINLDNENNISKFLKKFKKS